MNERYQSEEHSGVSRKERRVRQAKAKAAASVIVQSSEKSPQQKKAERKGGEAQAEGRAARARP